MFTGIIANLGKLDKKENAINTFKTSLSFCNKLHVGTSVAVNGVCLTVFSKPQKDAFSVEIMPETAKKTTLSRLSLNEGVNLELPVSLGGLFSGHIIQGHIDGIGKIQRIKKDQNSRLLTIGFPVHLSRYIVQKGSIAVNGISLTIIMATKNSFTVAITSYTWQHTMLHKTEIGNLVNIEVDILAKYVEKLLKQRQIT